MKFDRPNINSSAGDGIAIMSFNADDATGTTKEWGRISAFAQNVSAGNQDGRIGVWTAINGATPVEVFNFNGADNENNSFRPLDLNGNTLKTSTGDMTITSATSTSGTGSIILTAKATTGAIQLTAPNNVNVIGNIQVGSGTGYNFIQTDAIDIFDTATATANTTASLGKNSVGFTRLNTTSGLSQSFYFDNDSASGGVINYQNTIGTNGMILTTNQSIELNTTTLKLANTTTANSTTTHTSALATTSNIGDITTYLKLQLNGNDIWIPYFTQDPSI